MKRREKERDKQSQKINRRHTKKKIYIINTGNGDNVNDTNIKKSNEIRQREKDRTIIGCERAMCYIEIEKLTERVAQA